jgi:pyruvate,water dikinase
VVGTGNAGERIKTGDHVRINGATGVVEVLSA